MLLLDRRLLTLYCRKYGGKSPVDLAGSNTDLVNLIHQSSINLANGDDAQSQTSQYSVFFRIYYTHSAAYTINNSQKASCATCISCVFY